MINMYNRIGVWMIWFLFAAHHFSEVSGKAKPNYHPCTRSCTKNSTAMLCYYKFVLEYYSTVGQACDLCSPNGTYQQLREKPTCQCVFADGYERGILTINRMFPGPSIQVCLGDTIVVDVENAMDGQEVTIHWHGIFQKDFQYYDGVPFITQCPISSGQVFRYKFGANNQGTHFYHSHSGVQKIDGINGALIVRQLIENDFHQNNYDYDLPEHVVFLSDIMHRAGSYALPGFYHKNIGQLPDALLINGYGSFTDPSGKYSTNMPLEIFYVKPNKRYRFRFINAFSTVCVSHLIIEGHNMTIVNVDGEDVLPRNVGSVMTFSGERYDVIIETNQPYAAYWIQMVSVGECNRKQLEQTAILKYEGQYETSASPKPTFTSPLSAGETFGLLDKIDCSSENHEGVYLTDLESVKNMDPRILNEEPDEQILLPFKINFIKSEDAFIPGDYESFIMQSEVVRITVDGIIFKAPPSPMISQYHDKAVHGLYCNRYTNRSLSCKSNENCSCSHIYHVKLGSVVEVVLWDASDRIDMPPHPFHQHGYSFYVMKQGAFIDKKNNSQVDIRPVLKAYRAELRNNKIKHPPAKDTIVVPGNGYVIYRFVVNNPGYWLLHCHFLYHSTIGMNIVIHVGENSDLPPVPKNFPTCGHFYGN